MHATSTLETDVDDFDWTCALEPHDGECLTTEDETWKDSTILGRMRGRRYAVMQYVDPASSQLTSHTSCTQPRSMMRIQHGGCVLT